MKKGMMWVAALCLCLTVASTASAAFVPFAVPVPGGAYTPAELADVTSWRMRSTVVPFPGTPTFTSWSGPVAGLPGGDLVITGGGTYTRLVVGAGWATWSLPPLSDVATPVVAYTGGASTRTLTFDDPVGGFSFELEPNPFAIISYTVSFAGGGMITAAVNGSAGARMFGGEIMPGDAGITGVTITGGADFAIAQTRAIALPAGPGVIPEPSSIALLGLGFAGLVGYGIRRRLAK